MGVVQLTDADVTRISDDVGDDVGDDGSLAWSPSS
jgi:hypothetical protein